MTSASDFGIYAENCNLTLSGSFTFRGNGEGIHAHHYLTIESGSVKAVGNSYGINSNWKMTIGANAKRVEAEGHMAYYGNTISIQGDQKLTVPKGGYIYSGQWVMDANGDYAGHMVIQKPVTLELDGQGTSGSPYLIGDADDWNNLADYIDSGADTRDVYFKLANDISVTTVIGVNFPFSGYFDGDGKTLTVNLASNSSYCAPFSTISDATIINLRTEGTVTCGIHGSGLVGRASGGTNDIIDCVVNVNITTSQSHSGGIIGHGGDKGKTTLLRCVFSGSITGATYGATLWGWSDSGTAVILDNCIDISDTTYPIGYGSPQPILQNVYYTHEKTPLTNFRPWEDNGKRAYSVTGVDLTLVGDTGIQHDGVVYAAKGETVFLKVPEEQLPCLASTGKLVDSGDTLTLTMSDQDVLLTPQTCEDYKGLYDGYSNVGNRDEGGENLTDNNLLTKWCVSKASFPISMTFRSIDEINVIGYVLWTADDTKSHPGRNPVSWTLEGSKDGENWTLLTNVKDNNHLAEANYTANAFGLTNPSDEDFSYFRFTVNKIKEGTTFQLSELQLLAEGAPVNYDLWVGSTRVSSKNQDDILNDGGKAKFDPQTHTLTLCDPIIDTNYAPTETRGPFKIYAENMDLIVKGSYHMTDEPKFGIYADEDTDLTLDGNFTFNGYNTAIYGNKDVTLTSGVIVANGGSIKSIFCSEKLTIEDGVERIRTTKGIRAVESYTLGSELAVITPENGKFGRNKNDTYYCVLDSDGNETNEVIIENTQPYNLWVGATQVTYGNKSDILNDGGKAKFDPETNTLTLNKPIISDYYQDARDNYAIYSENLSFTLKGSFHMPSENYPSFGVYLENGGSLILDGDFSFIGENCGAFSNDLTIRSGVVIAKGVRTWGLCAHRDFKVENDAEYVEVTGKAIAIEAEKSYSLGTEQKISVPQDGEFKLYKDYAYRVFDASGKAANHVVIESSTLYDLWVGSTRVTSRNKDDILHDGGKAKYDPETKTLTLCDPVIDMFYTDGDIGSAKIYGKDSDLIIKGSYHMSEEDENLPSYGVYLERGSLTLEGDFTFTGTKSGIIAVGNILFASGKVKAVGPSFWGVCSTGVITIQNSVEKLDFSGSVALDAQNGVGIGSDLMIIIPDNGQVKEQYYTHQAVDADGNTAKRVIIGKKPLLGDADNDGVISVLDATCIQKKLASVPVEMFVSVAADTDKDTKVTILDATYIQKHLASIPTPYVIGQQIE